MDSLRVGDTFLFLSLVCSVWNVVGSLRQTDKTKYVPKSGWGAYRYIGTNSMKFSRSLNNDSMNFSLLAF